MSEEGGPDYPVIMGDYAGEQARWESRPIAVGALLRQPTPLFAKLDETLGQTGPAGPLSSADQLSRPAREPVDPWNDRPCYRAGVGPSVEDMDRQPPNRRTVLRGGVLLAASALVGTPACSTPASPATTPEPTMTPTPTEGTAASRTLLAFFSRAGENYYYGGRKDLQVGNTEVLARMISELIDCDEHRIEAADPYPASYDATVRRNVDEQDADARPAIANPLPSIEQYDVVLLGSPNGTCGPR